MSARARSAHSCLLGAAAMVFVTTTGATTGCVDAGAPRPEPRVHVEVTTPDGAVHDTWGDAATLIAPLADELPHGVFADGVATMEPSALVTAERVEVTLISGQELVLERDGDWIAAFAARGAPGAAPLARFAVDLEETSLDIAIGDRVFHVDADGVDPARAADYLGGFLLAFLDGTGLEQVAGLEEAHAFWVAVAVFVVLLVVIGGITSYASMSECTSNQPTRCMNDAVAVCGERGHDYATATWSCSCGVMCAVGLGDVEASCEISCGDDPSPTPSPEPSPEPTPEPSPSPSPEPSPEPTPEPSPSPSPEPSPSPSPSPDPSPTPSPYPEP